MPTCDSRSRPIRSQGHGEHRRRQHHDDAHRVQDHTNSGSRNQVMPGARSEWMVTMKFRPVSIEEKPVMNTPAATSITLVLENMVENGV